MRTFLFAALIAVTGLSAPMVGAQDVPRSVHYQGRLQDNAGNPLPDETRQMVFRLYTSLTGGAPVWSMGPTGVLSSGGLLNVDLEPLTADDLAPGDLWLEIVVEGQTLSPRTRLLSSPFALRASMAVNNWSLTGNAGTDPAEQYVGTSDEQPLELRVNGTRAVRLEPSGVTPNIVGGHEVNTAASGTEGVFIGGGGSPEDTGWEFAVPNVAHDSFCVIGGGRNNQAGDASGDTWNGCEAAVLGGSFNHAGGALSFVGGGTGNVAWGRTSGVASGLYSSADGDSAFVGGGEQNVAGGFAAFIGGGTGNLASQEYCTVGGGQDNTAGVPGWDTGDGWATVGGGRENVALQQYSTVAGGQSNEANGAFVTIGGGLGNASGAGWAAIAGGAWNTAHGVFGAVPGGENNAAGGAYSFAAGRRAKAGEPGSFVWADSQDFDFDATAADEFSVRATGGVRLVSAIDSSGQPSAGVSLDAGDTGWNVISDRDLKTDLAAVSPRDVLERLQAVPVQTWKLKGSGAPALHMGPMAQDFAAAFGLGSDPRRINTVDADGVTLAAVQGLYQLAREQAAEISELRAQLKRVQEQLEARQR